MEYCQCRDTKQAPISATEKNPLFSPKKTSAPPGPRLPPFRFWQCKNSHFELIKLDSNRGPTRPDQGLVYPRLVFPISPTSELVYRIFPIFLFPSIKLKEIKENFFCSFKENSYTKFTRFSLEK